MCSMATLSIRGGGHTLPSRAKSRAHPCAKWPFVSSKRKPGVALPFLRRWSSASFAAPSRKRAGALLLISKPTKMAEAQPVCTFLFKKRRPAPGRGQRKRPGSDQGSGE